MMNRPWCVGKTTQSLSATIEQERSMRNVKTVKLEFIARAYPGGGPAISLTFFLLALQTHHFVGIYRQVTEDAAEQCIN